LKIRKVAFRRNLLNRIKNTLCLILAAAFLAGCAGQKGLLRTHSREPNPRAVELFMDGILYDQQQNFAAGLLSYNEALLYDTTSATLYLAIGRDYLLLGRDESALISLAKAARKDSRNVEVRSLLARAYLNLGQWYMAEKTYRSILALDSTNVDAYTNLALLHLKRNEAEKAADLLKKVLTVSPEPNPQVLNQLARMYADLKQYDTAAGYYKWMIDLDPRDGFGYFGLGTLLETRGDTTAAAEQYQLALALSPDLGDARERLGDIYLARKEFNQAIELYTEAVQKDSLDSASLLALASAYEDKGDTAKAETAFRFAKRRFSKEPQPLLDSGNFYMNRQKFNAALGEFDQVVRMAPQNFWGWLFSGVALVHMDSLEKALPRLQRALTLIPDDPMGNFYMGSALSQMKKPDEAVPYLKNALRIRPNWISALNALAGAYESMKEYARADTLFNQALKAEPDNALVLNNWSYSLSERNQRLDEALLMAQKALEKEPENGAYLDTMGWIHFKMGDFEKARDFIERALKTRAGSVDILDHLGDVYAKLGKPTMAREYWKKALDLDPQNAGIKGKLDPAAVEAR
jgi:tetratricopeptide (TPR) repeat protein